MRPFHPMLFALVLAGLTPGLPVPLQAAEGGFTATLSPQQKNAAGLTLLTPEERAALDRLVAADVAAARRDNLSELGDTFIARRTEEERKEAGIDRLTTSQLGKLNEFVAAAIAAQSKPRDRPRLNGSDILRTRRQPEIHGSVSFAYGWGSGGRDYRTSSLWLDYYDPENRFGLSVGLSTFNGDGLFGYYPDYYPRSFHRATLPVYFDRSTFPGVAGHREFSPERAYSFQTPDRDFSTARLYHRR